MTFKTRPGRMGCIQLEECDETGEYIRLVAEFFYGTEAEQVCAALNNGSVKFVPPRCEATTRVIEEHWGALNRLEDNEYWKHKKEDCVVYQEGGPPCPDCYDDESTVSKTESVESGYYGHYTDPELINKVTEPCEDEE